MRHYTSKTEQRTVQILEKTTCDKCGKELPEPRGYDTRDFELEFTHGSVYEGGYTGNREGWKVDDLCDTCVKTLHYLLEDNGFTLVEINEVW